MELENTNSPVGLGAINTGDAAAEPVTLTSLADLLDKKPEDKPSDDGKKGAAGGNAKEAKPKMFNDLAGSLGIGLDDLYKLEVSTVDGKTVSIEDLKALQGTQDDFSIRELEFEETRSKKEGDLRQAQSELAEIVSALPEGTLRPDVLEKLRAKNLTRNQAEKDRTMEAIPTWSDEATRTKDITGMASHLEKFGFPANYIASVVDHRMFVFIRESYLREKRINTALAKVRAGKPNPTTASKTVGKVTKAVRPKNSNARNGLEAFLYNA